MGETRKEAVLWESVGEGQVQCNLCNFRCQLADGKLGICQVRVNEGGTLYSLNYHKVCSTAIDPIEIAGDPPARPARAAARRPYR